MPTIRIPRGVVNGRSVAPTSPRTAQQAPAPTPGPETDTSAHSDDWADELRLSAMVAGGCLPCQAAALADPDTFDLIEPEGETVAWEGPITFEEQLTGDGRLIETGALEWDTLPVPLRHVVEDVGAHMNAVVVGRILTIERRPGGVIWATGDFDLGSAAGVEAARQVREGLTSGVSVDLDAVSFEVRVAREVLDEMDALADPDEDGEVEVQREEDEDGRVTVIKIDADAEVTVFTEARIRAATLVAIPAFEGARIDIASGAEPPAEQDGAEAGDPPAATEDEGLATAPHSAPSAPVTARATVTDRASAAEALVAAAAPTRPPADWFEDPHLAGPTPVTVTDEGRIFGHLATWGTCHIGNPEGPGRCTEAPRSITDYAYFRTGETVAENGDRIPVGVITLDTLHARGDLGARATMAHYEDTGTGVADVTAGEDEHGVWVAGSLRSSVTPDQVRVLRASPLSGDWRRIGGNLELVAALAVNVPGFPVPRPSGLVASGLVQSLVASGMVPPARVIAPGQPGALSVEDLRYLKALAAREKATQQQERTDKIEQVARDQRARKLAATIIGR